jgi:hypothetical protein
MATIGYIRKFAWFPMIIDGELIWMKNYMVNSHGEKVNCSQFDLLKIQGKAHEDDIN